MTCSPSCKSESRRPLRGQFEEERSATELPTLATLRTLCTGPPRLLRHLSQRDGFLIPQHAVYGRRLPPGRPGSGIVDTGRNGSGVFSDTGQALATASVNDVVLADIDGDGDLDQVLARFIASNAIWTNDGSGTFTNSGQNLGAATSTAHAAIDIDLDGDLDRLVSDSDRAADPGWPHPFHPGGWRVLRG